MNSRPTECCALPDGPLIAWYGDDFTGAAAVMEVLEFSGLPSVLFMDAPSKELLARHGGRRGIGVAGVARSKTTEWMDRHLPGMFAALSGLAAPIFHYKICSTFDSSPRIGSIGRAAELALPALGGAWHPMIVAAPDIRRYQAFGNLFASVGGTPYRLDRHPTMSRHPVTPMTEADVRVHLGMQTKLPIELIDAAAIANGGEDERLRVLLSSGSPIVAIDVLDDASLAAAGGLVWRNRGERLFAIGSQGVEYALAAHWRSTGALAHASTRPAGRARRIAGVSGSCSPVTAEQLQRAKDRGFQLIRLNAALAVDQREWEREVHSASSAARAGLDTGREPIVHSAMGPDDPCVREFRANVDATSGTDTEANDAVGDGLGAVLGSIVETGLVDRVVVAGGDTAGRCVQALGIDALTAAAPVSPGVAVCKAHSSRAAADGLEIVLKGGQMGEPEFFSQVKSGRAKQ